MEEKKKRLGKKLKIELKATIIENGTKRIVFYNYPKDGSFERPIQILKYFVAWIFGNFPNNLERFDCVRAAVWVDKKEANSVIAEQKVMAWIESGLKKEKRVKGFE